MKVLFMVFLFFLMQSDSYAGWLWGPSTSEECIVENAKGIANNFAIQVIAMACNELFSPSASNEDKKWSRCVLKNMKGVQDKTVAMIAVNDCNNKFPNRK